MREWVVVTIISAGLRDAEITHVVSCFSYLIRVVFCVSWFNKLFTSYPFVKCILSLFIESRGIVLRTGGINGLRIYIITHKTPERSIVKLLKWSQLQLYDCLRYIAYIFLQWVLVIVIRFGTISDLWKTWRRISFCSH